MIDVPDVLAAMARRDLEREGVPMLLTLTGASTTSPGDPRRADGRRLAGMVREVHATLTDRRDVRRADPPDVIDGPLDDDHVPLDAVSEEDRLVAQALSVVAFADFGPDAPARRSVGSSSGHPGPDVGSPTAADDDGSASLPPDRLTLCLEALEEGRFVRTVNYHNTAAVDADHLRTELSAAAARFAPVGFEDMERLFATGEWAHSRPPLLPVFYEGYRNNAEVAAPICESVGLIGWFFVVTGFVDAPPGTQAVYADAHFIVTVPEERDQGRLAMTWDQVAVLSDRHVVNPHTANHEAVMSVRTAEDFEREVAEPSSRVQSVTGRPAPGHAWLFGTRLGMSLEHDRALHHVGYRWCFSNTDIGAVAIAER